jgi:hypothetical protein
MAGTMGLSFVAGTNQIIVLGKVHRKSGLALLQGIGQQPQMGLDLHTVISHAPLVRLIVKKIPLKEAAQ